MAPLESLDIELSEKHIETVGKFVADIRNNKLSGSEQIAEATLTLVEKIISDSNATARELCGVLRAAARRISSSLPLELVAINMIRRVLRAIRDENRASVDQFQSGEGVGESLQGLVLATPARHSIVPSTDQDLREPIRDHIAELRTELETMRSSITSQAREHVRADEVLLTFGASALVERFLRPTQNRNCKVVVAEGTDVGESHAMARRLSNSGVSVTVINSSCVFAVMSRVNKVVVEVQAAMGGGAVLGDAGLHSVTLAAKYYKIPVVALAPLYRMLPHHLYDPQSFGSLSTPLQTMEYADCGSDSLQVLAPKFDFVPPDHITLFITNQGGSCPSYIYRLLSEIYDPKDYQI